MQQVFHNVNALLRNTHEAQRRKLFINTYKVIPLDPKVGVIQWVDGTTTLADYIFRGRDNNNAHKRYRPDDWSYVERASRSCSAAQPRARAQGRCNRTHW